MEIVGLSKKFGKTQALEAVSLLVGVGEAVGLVGPNGSGKTTFLRGASGLLQMDSGRSSILGHDVLTDRIPAMAALGFVPELPAPFGALTPREHLLFAARMYTLPTGWEPRAEEVLRRLDLNEQAEKLCSELSKGQRQKVHIATVMLRGPAVVLLDEPLIGIDPRGTRAIKDWVRERLSEGGSFLISSHSLAFVEEVCGRFAILDHGRMVATGTLDALRRQAAAGGAASLEDAFLKLTEATTSDGPPR